MESRLLSVVITNYNGENYIRECIESVLNQTYKNLEIIIVDDGSKDNSLNVIKEYENKDSRISVIAKKNGGSVSARKAGLQAAKGEYITYIDGDDWIIEDHYEKIMSKIDDADIIAFSLTCVYDNNTKEVISNAAENRIYVGDELEKLKRMALYPGELGCFGLFPSMCAKVFRRELIIDNLMNVHDDIRMGDDGACTFPSICDAKKIIVDNKIAGYMYRKNIESSITSSYSFVEFERIEKLFIVLSEAFKNRNADYMMNQMTYYLAFLFRTEMVKELSYPKISNISEKIQHINIIKRYKWIKYIQETVDIDSVNQEIKTLVKNIDSPVKLCFQWYIMRKLRG